MSDEEDGLVLFAFRLHRERARLLLRIGVIRELRRTVRVRRLEQAALRGTEHKGFNLVVCSANSNKAIPDYLI